jgi:hypothetical protein
MTSIRRHTQVAEPHVAEQRVADRKLELADALVREIPVPGRINADTAPGSSATASSPVREMDRRTAFLISSGRPPDWSAGP